MSTLFWLWILSFSGIGALYLYGSRRARIAPVSYQFDWHPFSGVSNTLRRWGKGAQERLSKLAGELFHRLFHNLFHGLKQFHDRIFGKKVLPGVASTPSFFLKTIAEHKEETSEERKNGLS